MGSESADLSTSVSSYDNILSGPLETFKTVSQTIGGDVATLGDLVGSTFDMQRHFLQTVSLSKQPKPDDLQKLLKPTSELIGEIQQFRESNRRSEMFNHLSAISESIPALGWVAVSPAPAPYVKEMKDAGQFYTNRVLKDWKEKDNNHAVWVRSWVETLSELQVFVKQFHTTGLVWNPKGGEADLTAIPKKQLQNLKLPQKLHQPQQNQPLKCLKLPLHQKSHQVCIKMARNGL